MPETLAQKILTDGSTLYLQKYQLTKEEAEALSRPDGSDEIVLVCRGDVSGGGTQPRASWYLKEDGYIRLYEAIKDEKDFKKVQKFLNDNINSSPDVGKIQSLLDML